MKLNGYKIVQEVIAPASSYAGDTQRAPSMVKTGALAGLTAGIGAGIAKGVGSSALKNPKIAASPTGAKIAGALSKAPVGKIAGGAALLGVGTAAALKARAQLNRGNQTLRQ